ncbi:MAG: DEAD/DEAH box helicase [Planctomycetes bacterium]|nr:DEAD/DEAH box helicase [Planctomycetota bacterium]
MNHLLFLPHGHARFFAWGADRAAAANAGALAARARVVDEEHAAREVEGVEIPLLDALPALAAVEAEELERASPSVAVWSCAAKLALELVARERIVPRVVATPEGTQARWGVAWSAREDAERLATLVAAMPPAAHAVPLERAATSTSSGPGARTRRTAARRVVVWSPEALMRTFFDCAADALVRAALRADGRRREHESPVRARRRAQASDLPWHRRFATALQVHDTSFAPVGFRERTLLDELDAWAAPARGLQSGAPRACLRLELPSSAVSNVSSRKRTKSADDFRLRYFLQAGDDPSLLLSAADVWRARGKRLEHLGRTFSAPQEHLLRSLGLAARLFPPIARSLDEAAPSELVLDATEAWSFLGAGAAALREAGLAVVLPAELTRSGRRRLKLKMLVGARESATRASAGASTFGESDVFAVRWEVALGDESLSVADLRALARFKAPLVRWRGQWVAVESTELQEAQRLLGEGAVTLPAVRAWTAALAGETEPTPGGLSVAVVAEGALSAAIERLRGAALREAAPPATFRGVLRPYQARGVAWLATMAELGLGGCLADDMGLGKTVQVLAYLLLRREVDARDRRPVLLVCPTSVVANWEREAARFAPSIPVVRHYGDERARSADALARNAAGALVVTTYGLLRRDAELFGAVAWSVAILDEAQNVKNPASRGARAARSLRASHRIAMTGTPVENRLSELWSILEFTTPGVLGSMESFRRTFALPVERWGDAAAAERLARIVRPFLLRRLKSDPAVIRDLPPKNEMTVACSLTREQATLYQAALDEALEVIADSEGIARRGKVLALITALKQICNHPAQFLGESAPLEQRSGKLSRLTEMLEEALAEGDKALVFTQYREMGERLVTHLSRALAGEVLFLHGGTSLPARERMVRRFQEEVRGPRVFVLSLKAGGTGLNLTAATRVFHFDRWWNPAVEDQATDRAWRIGQTRAVAVHKLVCAGTVEERVARLLESKRSLAARVVGAGESWITELGTAELRELCALAGEVAVDGEDTESEAFAVTSAPRTRRQARKELSP